MSDAINQANSAPIINVTICPSSNILLPSVLRNIRDPELVIHLHPMGPEILDQIANFREWHTYHIHHPCQLHYACIHPFYHYNLLF